MRLHAMLAAVTVFAAPWTAEAAGLFVAKFGGELGHATTSNPTAVYYNPAGLALGKGHRLMLDGTFARRTASFDRPETAIGDTENGRTPADGIGANSGIATLDNPAAVPFFALASDLGVKNLGVGLAFFAPIGGAAKWDPNDAYATGDNATNFPGAADGVARWWSIEGSLTSLYFTGSAAYKLEQLGLSLGLSVNFIKTQMQTIRARNGDGSDDLVLGPPDDDGNYTLKEGRVLLDVEGNQLSIGVGVIWEPAKDTYIGLSWQSRPNISGGMTLSGTIDKAVGETKIGPPDEIELLQDFADLLRLGVRYRPNAASEIRLGVDFARWSALERQCILRRSVEDRRCEIGDGGSAPADAGVFANVERHWQDALGFKVGYSRFLSDKLEAFAGLGWDGSAVPAKYMDPALFDLPKLITALGARYQLTDSFAVLGTATKVTYLEVDSTGKSAGPGLEAPSTAPDAGGVYNQDVVVANIAIEAGF